MSAAQHRLRSYALLPWRLQQRGWLAALPRCMLPLRTQHLQPWPPAHTVYNMAPWITQARLRWTTATSSPTPWPWPPPFTSPACVATGQRVGMGERCFEDCCEDAPCMCLPGPAALTRGVPRSRRLASMSWHSTTTHRALSSCAGAPRTWRLRGHSRAQRRTSPWSYRAQPGQSLDQSGRDTQPHLL